MITGYITGLGAMLPNEPVTNDHIEDVLGHIDGHSTQVKDWVLNYNGIQTRYYAVSPRTGCPTHSNAQMTAEAVRMAALQGSLPLGELECLASGTSSADQIIPAHGVMVHGELGCPPCEVMTTAGVCCSGMTAFKYAYMNVVSGQTKNAVSTGSELASLSLKATQYKRHLELKKPAQFQQEPMLAFENDFLRWMLSDGAGAALISDTPRKDGLSLRVDWVDVVSYANAAETCMYCGGQKQKGGALLGYRTVTDHDELARGGYMALAQDVRVLRTALPAYAREAILRARARHDIDPDQIDWFLPHYSSEGFRQPLYDGMMAEGLGISFDRWFTNLKTKGNTGSASIYIILEELFSSGRVQPLQRILCFVPESARFTFSLMHLTAIG
jgi:3-oxoacyl-[acyl-carrier-protein] synthase III